MKLWLLIVYLLIGFITGSACVEFAILYSNGDLDFKDFGDDTYYDQTLRYVANNKTSQIVMILLLMLIWPGFTYKIGLKMQLMLCIGFISDCIKGFK